MPYQLQVPVLPDDCDELGHASNMSYLRWTLAAALAHSGAVGLTAADYRALGQSFVVRRHLLDYLRQALPGEALVVETRVVRLAGASSQRQTLIYRVPGREEGLKDELKDELIFRALTDWAFIDLRSGRPTRIPADIRARFAVDPLVEAGAPLGG